MLRRMFKPLLILELIVAMLFLYRCSSVRVADDLSPYYEEYMGMVRELCPEMVEKGALIKFGPTISSGPNAIAFCSRRLDTYYTIVINPDYYRVSNPLDRKSTMFHELSHCVLGLPHSDNPYNYMFFAERPIMEAELIRQVKYDIVRSCNAR